jgi:gamma-glutamyltranspeptidase/glutathione hydrolase
MLHKRAFALLALPLLLGGCDTLESVGDSASATLGLSDRETPERYTDSATSEAQRVGVVVSDEPLAAKAGAAALASQGNAVDAVTTMFFTLTATYPVAAGLGGGGICLVREASGQVTEYDFLARNPSGGGAYAVPGAVRGFYDMQHRYGSLPWQRTVGPAEAYAATGFPISQALSVRLTDAQNVVRLDAGLASEFLDESGQPKLAGTEVRNGALALTLGAVRLNGADGFYKSETATRIAAYARAQGGAITAEDMAATVSLQGPARSRGVSGFTSYLPGARTGAGAFSGALLDNLSREIQGGRDMQAATANAVRTTLSGFGVASLPKDLGSTGFAAVDVGGQAASCAVTLNGPFGSGHTAGDTGVQLAASPAIGQTGLASAFLTPIISADANGVALAGAGAGGPNGAAAAAYALLQTASGRQLGKRGDLRGTGAAPFDTVNVISCGNGICVPLSDPGAHGTGAVADSGR